MLRSLGPIAALLLATNAEAQSMNYVSLFDGSLAGWTIEQTAHQNFTIDDGVLRVAAPEGWLKSAREYSDFDLRVEFRFLSNDADSGIFIRAVGTEAFARGWPNRSYQVQIRNPLGESRFAPTGGLFRHGMPAGETSYDEALARQLSLPTGEWQSLLVTVSGTEISAALNGQTVLEAGNIGNARGHIGLQGETGAVEFRLIEIHER
jgi:hypothetical protein